MHNVTRPTNMPKKSKSSKRKHATSFRSCSSSSQTFEFLTKHFSPKTTHGPYGEHLNVTFDEWVSEVRPLVQRFNVILRQCNTRSERCELCAVIASLQSINLYPTQIVDEHVLKSFFDSFSEFVMSNRRVEEDEPTYPICRPYIGGH